LWKKLVAAPVTYSSSGYTPVFRKWRESFQEGHGTGGFYRVGGACPLHALGDDNLDCGHGNDLYKLKYFEKSPDGSREQLEMIEAVLDIARFLVGFLPWILFLFLPTEGWEPLRRAVLICLAASVVFSWKALRERFLLQWTSTMFFLFCALAFYGFNWVWLARHMSVVANLVLDGTIWLTVVAGRPFTLQYAQLETPREFWDTQAFRSGCRSIAIFWGVLLLVPSVFSIFRLFSPGALPNAFYFLLTIFCMVFGIVSTTIFKRVKRKQRMAFDAESN
jgi:hypothetical protein